MKNLSTYFYSTVILNTATKLIVVSALLMLAYEPVIWLVNTWQDDSFDSTGVWAFIATAVLLFWSASSALISQKPARTKLAIALLVCTAVLRLLGQILAINTLGALALVVDVYAIALLFRVKQREHTLSAGWLALLFAFSLPVERIIQRIAGYGLQELSSSFSCSLLTNTMTNVVCHGTRIAVEGKQFLIDLPCAGTNSLVVLAISMTAGMALARPTYRQSLVAMLVVLLSALLSNILRILLLVSGSLSDELKILGIDVMQQPWHDITGLIALFPFLALVIYFSFQVYRRSINNHPLPHTLIDKIRWTVPDSIKQDGWWLPKHSTDKNPVYLPLLFASLFLIIAFTTINLKRQALDVQQTTTMKNLPIMLGNQYAQPIALLPKEKAYFTQFGGDARKAIYGNRQLLISKTSSPLRHLHAPDECLRGLGFDVHYLGTVDQPVSTAIYKATAPDGQEWKVAISFISNNGKVATNVSEAVWQWLKKPDQIWYSLQRISPWQSSFQDDRQWDRDVLNAVEDLFKII